MIEYRPQDPLIFIHTPKTAGISVRTIFTEWFGEGLLRHYANQRTGNIPAVIDIKHPSVPGAPACLFGHFNYQRGFGIPGRYDWVKQFITILRDPLEQTISRYFYLRANSAFRIDQSRVPKGTLEEYIRQEPSTLLIHFPKVLTKENFKDVIEENFIAVGITERVDDTIRLFARRLGFHAPNEVPFQNRSERDQILSPELRDQYADRFPLEHTVYEYCCKRFEEQIRAS